MSENYYPDDMSEEEIEHEKQALLARLAAKKTTPVDPRDAKIAELEAQLATEAEAKAAAVAEVNERQELLNASIKQAQDKINADKKALGVATSNNAPSFENMGIAAANKPPVEWLIEGVFERKKTVVLIGPPGHGKSTVSFDWAACIASGKDFHGKRVQRGAVFYVAAEDDAGTLDRWNVWGSHNNIALAKCPLFIMKTAFYADVEADVEAVKDVIAEKVKQTGVRPSLIVIDTLNCCFSGEDENNAADMAKFLAGTKVLRDQLDATVLILHHPTKGDPKNGRGSGSVKGHVDREYFVVKDEKTDVIEFSPGKVRGEKYAGPPAFKFIYVGQQIVNPDGTLSGKPLVDNFGNISGACVLEETEVPQDDEDGATSKPVKLSKEDRARELLKRMMDEADGAPIEFKDWRKAVLVSGIETSKNFGRIKTNLVDADRVIHDEDAGVVWVPDGDVAKAMSPKNIDQSLADAVARSVERKFGKGGNVARPAEQDMADPADVPFD